MNIFELFEIKNPEAFVPVFLVILAIEIIVIVLIFRLIRITRRRKKESEAAGAGELTENLHLNLAFILSVIYTYGQMNGIQLMAD